MTTSLYWVPVIPQCATGLSDQLKFALRKRWGPTVSKSLGYDELEYLRGLADAGLDDALILIEAIHKHDKIEVGEQ